MMAAIPHNRLTHGTEELEAVVAVIHSGQWAGGPKLAELEARLAAVAGRTQGVGVGSGVAALRLALLALGVGPGTSVAVPAYCCVALPNAVLACGGEVVPVDVQAESLNLCPSALQAARACHGNLAAVAAVHTFGAPAQVADFMTMGLPVIEDCSHAFGAGSLGRDGSIVVLSLYASKLIGSGEGGMILTSDAALAARIREERDYADKPPSAVRLNDKMTDVEAALALCQLDRLQRTVSRREELARRYSRAFAPLAEEGVCILPADIPGRVWYRYVVRVDDPDRVIQHLADLGVVAARPVENWGGATAATPAALAAYGHLVSLPLYPALTSAQQEVVISAFVSALAAAPPL